MRKGFTRKPQRDEPATPGKNHITPSGLQGLKDEHRFLLTNERPASLALAEANTWVRQRRHRGFLLSSVSSSWPMRRTRSRNLKFAMPGFYNRPKTSRSF